MNTSFNSISNELKTYIYDDCVQT